MTMRMIMAMSTMMRNHRIMVWTCIRMVFLRMTSRKISDIAVDADVVAIAIGRVHIGTLTRHTRGARLSTASQTKALLIMASSIHSILCTAQINVLTNLLGTSTKSMIQPTQNRN